MFEMGALEARDIDDEAGFRIAELLYLERQGKTEGGPA
jgi:CMP-N-acetylneuraminic acid synthetase